MINKTHFWIGLAAAAAIAAGLLTAGDKIAAWAADIGIGPAVFGVPLGEPLVMGSLAVALGTLAWMIIGWTVPLIGLDAQIGEVLEDAADPEEVSFETLNERLEGSLLPRFPVDAGSSAPFPRETSGPALLNQFADAWFFRSLPLAALGLGGLIALLSLIHGQPAPPATLDSAIYEALALPAPVQTPLALGCFTIAAAGAFFAALLYWLTAGSVSARLDRLIAVVCARLQGSGVYRLEYRMAEALAPVAEALSDTADKLAETQAATTREGIEAACERFLTQLEEATGNRTAALADTMTAMERSAAALLDAVAQTEARLSAAHEAHAAQAAEGYAASLQALHQQQAGQVQAMLADFRAMAEELRAMTEAAVSSVTEQVSQTRDATQQALNLLAEEAGGAKSIGQAADQMAAAARASRETVERFIQLAERMRDLSQSVTSLPTDSGTGTGTATAASATPTAANIKRIDPPLTSPETAKRLSSAIRNLKQAVDEPLPEL
ncbi:MAG TPA: hypothetical protein VKZ46_04020 [Pedomonas sp.]|nr:hypothetical protein [Pedomonas sp.]